MDKYQLGELQVGDSRLFTLEELGGNVRRVRVAASMYTKRTGRRFACRSVNDGTRVTGVRVWRTQ